jgi:class 3 adenylate cyclase
LSGKRVERRLAVILAADVAGYSRLMGQDEAGTLARLKAHRRGLIDPSIAEHKSVQMAEVAVPRRIFANILPLIARLRAPPAPA